MVDLFIAYVLGFIFCLQLFTILGLVTLKYTKVSKLLRYEFLGM